MDFIKEYCPEAKRCIIRTKIYAKSFEYLRILVEIAKNDFPNLDDSEIDICHYGRNTGYQGTFGIEFYRIARSSKNGSEYKEIEALANVL